MDGGDWSAASGDATRQNDELSLAETGNVILRGVFSVANVVTSWSLVDWLSAQRAELTV